MKDPLLIDSELPIDFWAEAMETTNYLCNRLPTKARGHREVIPEEKWCGSCQNLSHICIFGSEVLVDIPKEKKSKRISNTYREGSQSATVTRLANTTELWPQKQSKSSLSAIHLSMNP